MQCHALCSSLEMDSEQITSLALAMESEELIGVSGHTLVADDIVPIIESLWERGVDFTDFLSELEADDEQGLEEALEE